MFLFVFNKIFIILRDILEKRKTRFCERDVKKKKLNTHNNNNLVLTLQVIMYSFLPTQYATSGNGTCYVARLVAAIHDATRHEDFQNFKCSVARLNFNQFG
jgi:hypothetical protein